MRYWLRWAGVIVGVLGTERLDERQPIARAIVIVRMEAMSMEILWDKTTMDEWAGPVVFLPMPSSKMRQPEGAQG